MKNSRLTFKKLLSAFVAFTIFFSLFSGIAVVNADPSVSSILFERMVENTSNGPIVTNRLTIRGMNFENPVVFIGASGDVPIEVTSFSKYQIIIEDQDLLKNMVGFVQKINVYNDGTVPAPGAPFTYDLRNIPSITSLSTSKVYVGDPLSMQGMFAGRVLATTDAVYVDNTAYAIGSEAILDAGNNKISIGTIKSPDNLGLTDVSILRNIGGNPNFQVKSTLKNSIRVVNKLTGIAIERVDPNTGPRTKWNSVNIYGTPSGSNFFDNMQVIVNGSKGRNVKAIVEDGKPIGLSAELPPSNTPGAADIIITDSFGTSEFIYPNGFIYLDIGNALSIDTDGIAPNVMKETEAKPVTIMGRNIGYFNNDGYDKISNVNTATGDIVLIKYDSYSKFTDPNTYKVKYKGKYNVTQDVTILREIKVFLDGDVDIIDSPLQSFTTGKDTIVVQASKVNLDPNEPKSIDVRIKTTTTIFKENADGTITIYYTREEEYTSKDGFTYIPDEISPEITSVTPDYGPDDKNIYMTIKGKNFQVFPDGTLPTVKIDNQIITDIKVYDDNNREVDGKKIDLGTKIKLILPPTAVDTNGAVDVKVTNPSKGAKTLVNGFEYRNPSIATRPTNKMPVITSLKEPYGDLRGGVVAKENVLITGDNIDTSGNSPRVLVTIDGEKATIVGRVSADGKTVTVTPPPGTLPGMTKLQLINEDGSLAEIDFEYKLIVTAPKITRIVPTKGRNGTKLVIKGEDFLLPDLAAQAEDPKRKGTVVLLNGIELNAYNYKYDPVSKLYSIADPLEPDPDLDTGIYFNGSFDPDGAGTIEPYQLNGKMITVVDSSTIYVDIPDRFYSLNQNGVPPYLKSELIDPIEYTVEVLNPDGAKSKENIKFEYVETGSDPEILTVTPISGSTAGGTVVRITGTDFKNDDSNGLKVYFGSELATKIDYINTTELIVQVPSYPFALPQNSDSIDVPIMVMNYDGAMDVFDSPFTYRRPGSKPKINSLSPSKGSAAGGERIIISGSDFRRRADLSGKPTVYFNGIEADVEWVSDLTLIVTAPPSKKSGPVDVVVVNHDAGSYTFKSYTYEISKPAITSLTPEIIAKQGGTRVQINGTGFTKGDLRALTRLLPDNPDGTPRYERVGRHTSTPIDAYTQIENLVIFGDESTGDKKVIDTVRGPRSIEINELKISYQTNTDDVNSGIVTLSRLDDTLIRQATIPFGSAHLFIVNGQQDLGINGLGDEGVLVEVTPNQAIINRRVAAFARWENDGRQITAVAPAVGSVNERNVYVRNADGGIADTEVDVLNPSSNPTITYISPRNKVKRAEGIIDYTAENINADIEYYTYTPLDGGAFITINGTDFRRGVKVYLGNKELEVVSRSVNDNQLVVKVPKGASEDLDKLHRILVVNEDGASVDSSTISKPHFIVYKMPESNPVIDSVTPANTSSKGQNTIRILGDEFKPGVKVLIDGIESPSVTMLGEGYTDGQLNKMYNALAVKVPLGLTPGKKVIQVINPDYGFAEKKDAINIVSSPNIDTVRDVKKDILLDPITFSIDGGQSIRLVGGDFLEGARVIIGGTLKPKADLKQGETGIPCYNIYDAEMVVVGGVLATNVKVENITTLTFTTPKLKVGDASVIVVNKDGGVSNVKNGNYQKPIPDAPGYINIEVVDSDTIKLEWSEIVGSNHYELYAAYSKDGSVVQNYVYVGSLKAHEISEGRLRYFVDGLKASSWYSFKIKSVNNYGPSSFSPSTNFVKTKDKKITTYYQVPGDYYSGIAQNDKVSTLGRNLTIAVGERSLGNYTSGYVAYFNQTNYSQYNPKTIDIGLEILRKYPDNRITVNEKDFTLKLVSNYLLVRETSTVTTDKLSDSKMSIIIDKDLKAKGDEIRLKLPKGYKAVTNPVAINVTMQVEKSKSNIKGLNGYADLSFNISPDVKKRYAGGLYIAYYNNTTKKLEILSGQNIGNILTTRTTKPGEYMLVGKFTR